MDNYRKCALGRKRVRLAENQPDLFTWADERAALDCLPMPRAAQLIARRFALSPHHARVIAEAAGFAMEAANG